MIFSTSNVVGRRALYEKLDDVSRLLQVTLDKIERRKELSVLILGS